jgi:tRNA threonylcarbamoyladenosine biosynthesis protein TsaB
VIVLGLDASAGVVGVALAGPGGPRGDLLAPDDHRPAAGLLAAAAELLARSGLGREGVQGLAVAVGPGSYAGVRAAVVTAKAWAWAAGLPLAAVGSLEAIAWAAAVSGKPVAAAIDARRGRVYGALYVREEEQLVELEGPAVRERRTWLDELRARDVVLAGRRPAPRRQRRAPWPPSAGRGSPAAKAWTPWAWYRRT